MTALLIILIAVAVILSWTWGALWGIKVMAKEVKKMIDEGEL